MKGGLWRKIKDVALTDVTVLVKGLPPMGVPLMVMATSSAPATVGVYVAV